MRIGSSETVFQGRVFDVRVDQLISDAGQRSRVDLVVHPGSVTILPVSEQGRLFFVRQYRHPAGSILLELPAGTLEQGEEALACARRETEEEIGLSPSQIEYLGSCFLAPGYTTEETHIYLASGLQPVDAQGDPDEEIEVASYDLPAVQHLASSGQIRDAKSLAAIYLASIKGRLPMPA